MAAGREPRTWRGGSLANYRAGKEEAVVQETRGRRAPRWGAKTGFHPLQWPELLHFVSALGLAAASGGDARGGSPRVLGWNTGPPSYVK